MFIIYKILIFFLILFSPIILTYRLVKGKEDKKRFIEKFSFINHKKRAGKLIWFHGSSIGEILSVIPLIEKFEKKKDIKQILITSNTLSSSKILSKFSFKKTIHQFFPIDSSFLIRKFLNHWKPSSVLFIESEIWPNAISEIKKTGIPLILLNARITKKTFEKWNKFKIFSKYIFSKFDICLCQNDETLGYLKKLGSKKVKKEGNLKFSNYNILKTRKLSSKTHKFLISKNILFGGISTHPQEEIYCAKIHKELTSRVRNSLTIIIPRHVHRAKEIKNEISNLKLKAHLHSSKNKISKDTEIYIVDTFGDTQIFIEYCKIVLLGGSLIPHGGQNPLEAARLGCKILHGPNINNFTEVYRTLNKYKIAFRVKKKRDAIFQIYSAINNKNKKNDKIKKLNLIGKNILEKNLKAINRII